MVDTARQINGCFERKKILFTNKLKNNRVHFNMATQDNPIFSMLKTK